MAHAGTLLAQVVDCVDTGAGGYQFLRLNTGMNDILRPSMYGAQHAMTLVPARHRPLPSTTKPYVIVGHNCESGDILTPAQERSHRVYYHRPRLVIGSQSIAPAPTAAVWPPMAIIATPARTKFSLKNSQPKGFAPAANYAIVTDVAAIAQLVERIHGKDEVSGSSPDRGSILICVYINILC